MVALQALKVASINGPRARVICHLGKRQAAGSGQALNGLG
jgi:hypothetical protein